MWETGSSFIKFDFFHQQRPPNAQLTNGQSKIMHLFSAPDNSNWALQVIQTTLYPHFCLGYIKMLHWYLAELMWSIVSIPKYFKIHFCLNPVWKISTICINTYFCGQSYSEKSRYFQVLEKNILSSYNERKKCSAFKWKPCLIMNG